VLTGHREDITGCATSPDGLWIVSTSKDGTLRIWDAATGAPACSFPAPGGLTACSCSPYDNRVCCADEGGNVYILELMGAWRKGGAGLLQPVVAPDTCAANPSPGGGETAPTTAVTPEIRRLIARAEAGDDEAQFELGKCYANGTGVVQDDVQAAAWYRRAAERGNTDAMVAYGRCLIEGRGVRADGGEGGKWFRHATEDWRD